MSKKFEKFCAEVKPLIRDLIQAEAACVALRQTCNKLIDEKTGRGYGVDKIPHTKEQINTSSLIEEAKVWHNNGRPNGVAMKICDKLRSLPSGKTNTPKPKTTKEAHMYCENCNTHWRAEIPVCPECDTLGCIGRL